MRRKGDPAQPVMLDFYRERYTASGESNKLLAVLSDAQRRAERDTDKAALALEIARLAQHDAQSAERAIDAFKLVLRHDPHHEEARSSLKELYRRSGKWNALVELLRGELDALDEGDTRGKLLLLANPQDMADPATAVATHGRTSARRITIQMSTTTALTYLVNQREALEPARLDLDARAGPRAPTVASALARPLRGVALAWRGWLWLGSRGARRANWPPARAERARQQAPPLARALQAGVSRAL